MSAEQAPPRRVSVNEVLRVARRALIALGAGAGCEEEPAQAVVWLEARGLGGLVALRSDLEAHGRFPPSAPRRLRTAGGVPTLEAGGASALFLALDAVAVAAAGGEEPRLAVSGARSPLWLAPALALAATPRELWGAATAGGEPVLQVRRGAGGAVSLHGGPAPQALHGLACELTLGSGAPPSAPPGWSLDPGALESRRRSALRDGVWVPQATWAALAAAARRALVPASEFSRRRGAGGGDDNA